MTVDLEEFRYLRDLVHSRSAIVLTDDKLYLAEARLTPIARSMGFASVEAVIREARSPRGHKLQDQLVDAMTTNETSWFRDTRPFEALRRSVLPRLVERNRSTQSLAIWSAACSTGQELYSVALILTHEFPALEGWNLQLLGTDLNAGVVDKASRGTYTSLEINRGLPAALVARYFKREGSHFAIDQSIRERVSFRQMNLASSWLGLPMFDLILLRNVLIYFDATTKAQILTSAKHQLKPGGYLALGGAETPIGVVDGYTPLLTDGATFYQVEGQP